MSLSMYQASVPVFVRALSNLRHVLETGERHAVDTGFDPEVLLQTRLTPDMLPLVAQVRIATDLVTRGAARLAGAELASVSDDETTFAQLYARIEGAIDGLRSFDAKTIDGGEARQVVLKMRTGEMTFEGQAYLLDFVLPNLFFHTTTTYAILRQCGVPLGKMDFIGKPG